MSWRTFGQQNIAPQVLGEEATPWKRPSAWLALTELTESDQRFEALHSVYEYDANFVALSAEGAYTVNWGDGTGNQNIATGVTAETNLLWANAPATSDVGIAEAVACTFQDTGDTVTVVGHSFVNRQRVAFNTINSTTGISTYTTYFVRDVSGDTFKVESTIGGGALTLTTDGTGSVYPTRYRQVIISVVPNGGNLTKLNLHVKHSQAGLQTYSSGYLDIAIAGAFLTDLRFAVTTPGSATFAIRHVAVEQINIVRSDLRQLSYLFSTLDSLRNVRNLATSTAAAESSAVTFTDAANTVTWNNHGFRNGDPVQFSSIVSTTGINTTTLYFVVGATTNTFQVASSYGGAAINLVTNGTGTALRGTSLSFCFDSCDSLTGLAQFDTSNVGWFEATFYRCAALKSVPAFDTSGGRYFHRMFSDCSSLVDVPSFDTSLGILFWSMFTRCYSLRVAPELDLSAGTDFSFFFLDCWALEVVPEYNTASGLEFNSFFADCHSLREGPWLDTSQGTDLSGMFTNCFSLERVPLYDTSSATTLGSMFNGCYALREVPAFNAASNTASLTGMFTTCNNLARGRLEGTVRAVSYSACKLSSAQLNDIYTGLGSVVATTITVSNNFGTTGDDPTIATAKGWTVTG